MTIPEPPTPNAAHQLGSPEHYDAVLDAEVARLLSILRDTRVMQEATLRQRMHADLWGAPGFEAALATAVEIGAVEQLLGYVRLPEETRDDAELDRRLRQRLGDRLRAHRRRPDEDDSELPPAEQWW